MVSTLEIYGNRVGEDGYELDFLLLARSVIREFLISKSDFYYQELHDAFWMMLPTYILFYIKFILNRYYDFDTCGLKDSRSLFYDASIYEYVLIDNNLYNKELKNLNNYTLKYFIFI
jgi:hypothetical protein